MAYCLPKSPLEIPHILEHIASFLPCRDVRSCRLVCKFWAEEMERRSVVLRNDLVVDASDLKETEKAIADKRAGLTVVFYAIEFKNNISADSPLLRRVLNMFGSTISVLVIYKNSSSWNYETLHTVLGEYVPNLEKLEFLLEKGPDDEAVGLHDGQSLLTDLKLLKRCRYRNLRVLEWDEGCPVDLLDLYFLFPNLTTLKVSRAFRCRTYHNPRIFATNRWKFLKTLGFYADRLHCYQFDVLTRMKLQLKSFSMLYSDVVYSISESHVLKRFLQSVAPTLEDLDIRFLPGYERDFLFDIVLPPMPNLIRLKILVDKALPFNVHNLNGLPKLEEFVSSSLTFSDGIVNLLDPLPYKPLAIRENLQSLKFVLVDDQFLTKFSQVCQFTSVTSLGLHYNNVSDEVFRTIVTEFPNLYCFQISVQPFIPNFYYDINSVLLTDAGITGISAEELNKLTPDMSIDQISIMRKFPWLGSLKNLQFFDVGTSHLLTDRAVLYGTRCVESLKKVSIAADNIKVQQPFHYVRPVNDETTVSNIPSDGECKSSEDSESESDSAEESDSENSAYHSYLFHIF